MHNREEGRDGGGVVVLGRAEIDTRAPFSSVKEAVMLFGEKVLAGEIYANKLKEIKEENESRNAARPRVEAVTAELEETKLSLKKAKEEGNLMSYRIKSLREELELTKKELTLIKTQHKYQHPPPPASEDSEIEIEDLKFIENSSKLNDLFINRKAQDNEDDDDDDELSTEEHQKKRPPYVKFASPPSLAKVIVTREEIMRSTSSPHPAMASSYGKKSHQPAATAAAKRRSMVPVLGWLFHKKKGGSGPAHSADHVGGNYGQPQRY